MRTIYRDVLLVQKLLPDIREFSEYFTFPLSSKSSGLKNLGAHVMQEEVYKTKVHARCIQENRIGGFGVWDEFHQIL